MSQFINASKSEATTQPSDWLSSVQPVLGQLQEVGSFPNSEASGNQGCVTKNVITKKAFQILNISAPFSNDETHQSCSIETNYGSVSASSYIARKGTLAGMLYDRSGLKLTPIAVKSSNRLLYIEPGSGGSAGFYVKILDYFDSDVESISFDRRVKHVLKETATPQSLKDQTGIKLAMRELAFSADGKWMVGDAPSFGLFRINLDTKELVFFDKPFKYNTGLTPSPQIAVSGDGRYVAISSKDFGKFKLYDLDTCAPNQTPNSVSVCQSRDLQAFIKEKVHGFLVVTHMNFSDEYTLRLYVGYSDSSGQIKRALTTLSAPGHEPTYYGYLGLGDSFAAGEGALEYRHGTDIKNPFNKCHLSSLSYPYLIGHELSLSTYQSVACSGAKIEDVNSHDVGNYMEKESQAEGKANLSFDNEIFSGFLPGYRTQLSFAEKYKPSIVTMSIGGNDINFGGIVNRCIGLDTCYNTAQDRYGLAQIINGQFDRLVSAFGQAKENAKPGAKIYIIGYPSIINDSGNDCLDNVHLNSSERVFANKLVAHLNFVIEKAARKAGVSFIDINNSLAGYRLCDVYRFGESGVNGLTAGNDIFLNFGPFGRESFHPTAFGQKKMKEAILSGTNNFTLSNPEPQPNTPAPDLISATDLIFPNSPIIERTVVEDDNMVDGIAYIEGELRIKTDVFAPGSDVFVEIKSTPTPLGSATVGNDGVLDMRTIVPGSLQPGFHTVHVYGKTISGEDMETLTKVYVAASETDYDGDGVTNNQDPCTSVEPSGKDYDKDGVDDACDGQISEPPADPSLPEEPEQPGGIITLPPIGGIDLKDPQPSIETVAGNEEILQPAQTIQQSSSSTQSFAFSSPILQRAHSADNEQTLGATRGATSLASTRPSLQNNNIAPRVVSQAHGNSKSGIVYPLAALLATILAVFIKKLLVNSSNRIN